MFLRTTERGVVVHAPAKVNLSLHILGRRDDGYHRVETLLVPVRLFDEIVFQARPHALTFRVAPTCNAVRIPHDQRNLAYQAVAKLSEQTGRAMTGLLTLRKRIPSQAGLGGGSSDAAAALRAANVAWGANLDDSQLFDIARSLGVDVPFFLHHGAAIGRGRGDELEPVAAVSGLSLVIVTPHVGLATKEVFDRFSTMEKSAGTSSSVAELATWLQHPARGRVGRSWFANSLQAAAQALSPTLRRVEQALRQLPLVGYVMSGSGSSYVGICQTMRQARQFAGVLRSQRLGFVYTTQSCL